ncbi:hypothetical protein IGI04_039437 [Brassica rapa subsp. trilocularis]|uniref:Uncharacterized protein n=1 Tax=Brassica rapa subsp. trilocularis TaxID=1813537 RepID=A0ABQ7KNY3_BRACM|nr:hypothetical protein IGI04_039437 [Brassica rapa subsp. trilocularis]
MPYSHINWSQQQQQQSLLTSAMIIPGLAQYALLLPQALKISPSISSLYNMNFEWDRHASKYNLDRTNRNNLPFGRSQELDLLLSQDMLRCQEILSQKGRRGGGGFRPQFRSNSQSNAS